MEAYLLLQENEQKINAASQKKMNKDVEAFAAKYSNGFTQDKNRALKETWKLQMH